MSLKEELEKDRKRKNSIEYEIFENILIQCKDHIRFENNLGRTYTIFSIPTFMLGYPVFSIEDCKSYIIKELKEQGIKVSSNGYKLHISWKSEITENIKKREKVKRTPKCQGSIFTKDDEVIFIRKK